MKNFHKISYRIGIVLLSAFLLLNACKKDGPPLPDNNDSTGNNQNPEELTARDVDSLRFYIWYINVSDSARPLPALSNVIWGYVPMYFWEDKVPDDFKWYSSEYNDEEAGKTANNLMSAIASYSPDFNGSPRDRYSFIDMKGTVSDELQGGKKGDFGYMVAAAQDKNNNIHLLIEYTYGGSPARDAGILRGDEILSINGNSDMDFNNSANVDRINEDLFQKEAVSLKLMRPDSSIYTTTLQRTEYKFNPVLFDSVYTVGGKKVGYFVYNTFVNIASDENGTTARQQIDTVFSKFVEKGVDELIVDLRYNGGGAVASSEYLAELIAPSTVVGQEMYHTEYNQPLTDFFGTDPEATKNNLDPVKFQSVSQNVKLNLNRVFFIVSGSTASASELTINNLDPYMNVQLVGKTTYGKPVGFFPLPINFVTENDGYRHVADMYAINFKSVNSTGKSDYFNGMTPDVELYDYVGYRWGDTLMPRLQSIFNKIENGSYLTQGDFQRKMQSAQARKAPGTVRGIMRKMPSVKIKNPSEFNGMVDYRKVPTAPLRKNNF